MFISFLDNNCDSCEDTPVLRKDRGRTNSTSTKSLPRRILERATSGHRRTSHPAAMEKASSGHRRTSHPADMEKV